MVNGLVIDGGGGVTVGSTKSMLSNNGNNTITSINVNSSIIRSQRSRNAQQQHPQPQQSQSSIQSNMSSYHSSASSFMNNNPSTVNNNNSNSTFNNNVSLNHGHSHHHHHHHHHGIRSSLTSTTGHGNSRLHHHHHHHQLTTTAAAASALHSSTVTTTVTTATATATSTAAITTASSTHSSSLLNSAANVYSHGDSKTSSTKIAAASALDDDDDAPVVDLVDGNIALSGANNSNNTNRNNNNSDNVAAMVDKNSSKDVGRIVNPNFNSPSSSTISIRPTNYILLNKLRVQQKHRQIRRQPSSTTTITTTTTTPSTLSCCTSNNNNNSGGTGIVNDVSVLGKLSSSNSVSSSSSVFGSTTAANHHKTSGSAALMSRFNNNKINNVMESSSNGQRSSKSSLNNDNRFSTTTMPAIMLRIPRITGNFMQANNSTTRPIITKVNASYWMNRVATNFSSSSAYKKKKDSSCNPMLSQLISNNNDENKKLNQKPIMTKNRMQQQQQQTKSSSGNGSNNLITDIYNNVPSIKKSNQSRNLFNNDALQINESSSSTTKNNDFSSSLEKPSISLLNYEDNNDNDNVHGNDQYAFRQLYNGLNKKVSSSIGEFLEQPPKIITTTETITNTATTTTPSSDRRSNPNNDVIVDIDVSVGDDNGSKSLNKHQMVVENDDHHNCNQKNDSATVVDMIQCDNNNVETIPVNTNTNVDMKIGCNMMNNIDNENCSGHDVGKVANNKKNESSKNQIRNILKFIEKSSPEFLFLLDKSANLSYQMALFEKKLDYLEKIFSNNKTSNENLQNSDSKRNDCEESILWSKVINRTRNWIKKSREKNLFLTNVELKPNVKRQFETKQQIIDEWKNLANNKQKNIFSANQDDDKDDENEVDDANASPFVSLSSKDELIILLERIAQFSSDIASQQHRKPFLSPSEKMRSSIADHSSKLILEKKNVFSNAEGDSEESQPQTQPQLSSIGEDATIKDEDNAARMFLMKLLGNQDLDGLANDDEKSQINCSKELLDRLQPDILKALVQIVKTNSLLVQVQREFDQLMCAHLKSYSQSLSKAKNKQSARHNTDAEHCNNLTNSGNHENQFMGISLPTSFNQTKRFHNNNNNNFNHSNVRIRGQLHQSNIMPMVNGMKCNSHNAANPGIVPPSISQKHHLPGTTTVSPSQQQCCKMNGTKMMFQDGDQYGGDCKLQNCMNFASDGDSGGEFTATTVTNEFNQCVTEDELSSLLNQIQLCSQKIIERSSGSNGSVNGNSGNLAISSSNNSTSSSGCCCSTGSEMKCNGTCSINQSQHHHHHHHSHHQQLQQRLLLNKDDETNQSVPPPPSSWPNRLVDENKCCCLNESMDRFDSNHLAKQKLQENQNFMGWPLDSDPMMANVAGNNMTGFMLSSSSSSAFDLMSGGGHQHLGPGLHGLNEAGCLNTQQATTAAATPSTTANTSAFIFDPNVDVESFLNVIEKELDENRFTSAPPFMSQDAANYLDNPPPLNYHNHRRMSNHRCSSNKDSNDHPIIDETAFCCQPRPQPGIITSASYFSSPLVNINNNNANAIVASNPTMMPMIRGNADVHHHNGSDHCPCSFNNNNNNNSNDPRSYPQQHQSLILAGGNWKLSQRGSTIGNNNNNSMNDCGKFNNINSIGNNSHYSSTMTSSLMANGSVPSSTTASIMMMAAAAADNNHPHHPYLVHHCQKPQQQVNQLTGNNNRLHLHRKETNNNNDLLDQYRSQVSYKINEETDRQLKEIDQWLFHHLEQTAASQTHLSRNNSNTGQNIIIPSSTNTDYEPNIINNSNINNNNTTVKHMQLSSGASPKAAVKLDSSSKNI